MKKKYLEKLGHRKNTAIKNCGWPELCPRILPF